MILRGVFILCFFVLISCDKKTDTIIPSTGLVIDEVSNQPVSGASIHLHYSTFCEASDYREKEGALTFTGADGRYYITFENLPGSTRPTCMGVSAKKDGYIGSKMQRVTVGIDTVNTIELYHSSEFHLHVKNDTIKNTIDKVQIWLNGLHLSYSERSLGTHPLYDLICQGRKFDSLYKFNSLWGNREYCIQVFDNSYSYDSYLKQTQYYITPLPDMINDFYISF